LIKLGDRLSPNWPWSISTLTSEYYRPVAIESATGFITNLNNKHTISESDMVIETVQFFFTVNFLNLFESLILAQDERWRCALGMQVER
jgi:hypothetical protein